MASASTSTTPDDVYARWTRIPDDELTSDDIVQCLSSTEDDLWVTAACVDRLLEDATLQRSLLDLGLRRTESAVERSREAYEHPSRARDEEEGEGSAGQTQERDGRSSLLAHFRSEPTDAQLCHMRAVLLERLDRLNTFVELSKVSSTKVGAADKTDDDWVDDPWADGSEEPQEEPMPELPLDLTTFLTDDLVDISCLLASLEQFAALRIIMERHGPYLWPCRYIILEAVPEHIPASQYRDLLPGFDLSTDAELKPQLTPCRPESDWSELPVVQAVLAESQVSLYGERPSKDAIDVPTCPEPLSSPELTAWYRTRVENITSSTGMVDIALSLVQHAASQGVPDLDEVGEDLSLLSRLVYDTPLCYDKGAEDDWTLSRWKSLDPAQAIRAYLAHSSPETIAKDISRLVMPYLFVLESRAERAGQPDPALPSRLLHDYILEAPLEVVAAIFEASKPTLPPAQRLLRDDEDMARLALACLYGSDSLDEWSTMSRIFECLPAWDTPEEDSDEADEADTTIASLGAFVVPSTTRPRCTPSDLLLFFKPLPTTSLSRALDVLDVHLESGEILSRWSVPAPLRWFLQSNASITEQRSWANRMARRAGGSGDSLESQDDWEWLLEDMLKLAGSGDSGLKGAFCLLSKDDIVRIFFSGLLSTGRFHIAKDLLSSSNIDLDLNPNVIEDICLTCSQEFYDNASSGNYHFGDMKLAYDCLDVPPPSERITKEKEFIEATSRLCSFNLMSRPGIPISPIEIRLTKDRLSLVSRVLSSNSDAYKHTQFILDLVHMLGFRGDTVAEVKTLAMLADTALQAEDFTRAYETSERMVNTVLDLIAASPSGTEDPAVQTASEVCWVACFQLGRQSEFHDVQKKLTLLGRALELCPADKLVDVLTSWGRLEQDDIEERRERVNARRNGTRQLNGVSHKRPTKEPSAASSLAARLQQLHMPDLHMPSSPLVNAPDAAALANKAFSRVAANFPFTVGSRGRSYMSDDVQRSRSGSRTAYDGAEVSAQASRVLQKGIGWLLGDDDS